MRVAVVGAGLMGSGIAQVAAGVGHDVTLVDLTPDALARARAAIEASLARFVAKGTLSEADAAASVARVRTETQLDAVADAELVVEAVVEDVDTKRALFTALDRLARPGVVLASNTSAIPITVLAAATGRAEAVVGTHFFSPVPMMALCELVRGRATSDATVARARDFAEGLGKTVIVVERDIAGFVTTRLIVALAMEAARLVEAGVVSAADLDTACRLAFGHPMGPLATADLTGIDILVRAAGSIYAETGQAAFLPPPLLARMVSAGELGRKSGHGFYDYPTP